jgi:uracil-DNA glycosylase family 4
MDSTKRTGVGINAGEKARDWLRYGEELGLGPYYRDRAPMHLSEHDSSIAPSELVADVVSPVTARTDPRTPGPSSSSTHRLQTMAPRLAIASAVKIVHAGALPSLFESIDRVVDDTLPIISENIGDCTRCKLHKGRTNIVFGVGNPRAELMFVGEGPGHDEDIQGEPFVGRAGKLLTQMIEAMGLHREDVYIANVVKCRPPDNRLPEKDEITTCSPFLMRQIDVIKPKVVCCLGSCAAQTLLQTAQGISKFRGEWFDFRGGKLIATYHPAYLLRNPPAKGEVWKDLQKVMSHLGLQPRKR